ncbi:selenoprotein N-like [Saccostrea cucullata]|uniref:selenoprotein N-like n=1 Tax=Saccostrea cuccullata TaxID=36930 RepID=UPI002ED2AA20
MSVPYPKYLFFFIICFVFLLCIVLYIRNSNTDFKSETNARIHGQESIRDIKDVKSSCEEGEILLDVNFQPLDLNSLGDEISGSNLVKSEEEYIIALLNWTKPFHNSTCIKESHFLEFFVPGKVVGEVWKLYEGQKGELSHNRHDPPLYSGIQGVLFDLLQNFHDKPFLQTRFEPRGGYSALRAINGDIADIYFRFHAEFQLNEKPLLPFWFTPAYFTGNIILDTRTKETHHFHLYVPNTNELNVDLEWYGSNRPNDNLMVDIGFLPVMELKSIPRSEELQWLREKSIKEIQSDLEKAFFPFKQVDYLPFEEAIKVAQAESKLIHHIVLWGSLDDQSC